MKRLIALILILLIVATVTGSVNTQIHYKWIALSDSGRVARLGLGSEAVITSWTDFALKSTVGDSIAANWAAWFNVNVAVSESTAAEADSCLGGAVRATTCVTADSSKAIDTTGAGFTTYVDNHSAGENVAVSDSTAALADSCLGGAVRAETSKVALGAGIFEADSITVITLDADTIKGVIQVGDTCDNGNLVLVTNSECEAFLGFEADSQQVMALKDVQREIEDSLHAHLGHVEVLMTTPHNQRYARTNDDTLMLEDAIGDTAMFQWRVVGGAANQAGVTYMTGTIPLGYTQLDTIIIDYLSSDADSTISSIDSMQVWVTSNRGKTALAYQASYLLKLYSTGRNQLMWVLGSPDGDFNGGEQMMIKFYTYVDEDKWIGVLNARGVVQ